MHGVAFRQADNTARHVPFSIAPMTMERSAYDHLRKVTPLIAKLTWLVKWAFLPHIIKVNQ